VVADNNPIKDTGSPVDTTVNLLVGEPVPIPTESPLTTNALLLKVPITTESLLLTSSIGNPETSLTANKLPSKLSLTENSCP